MKFLIPFLVLGPVFLLFGQEKKLHPRYKVIDIGEQSTLSPRGLSFDKRGFLYFGNVLDNTVRIFDGRNMKIIPGFQKGIIKEFRLNDDGAIYFSQQGDVGFARVYVDKFGKYHFDSLSDRFKLRDSLDENVGLVLNNQLAFFAYNRNVFVYDPFRDKIDRIPIPHGCENISKFNGSVYVENRIGQLMKWNNETFQLMSASTSSMAAANITMLNRPFENGILFQHRNTRRIGVFRPNSNGDISLEHLHPMFDTLFASIGVVVDFGDEYFVNAWSIGGVIVDKKSNQVEFLDSRYDLPALLMYSVARDPSGNYWIGYNGGLQKFERSKDLTLFDVGKELKTSPRQMVEFGGHHYIGTNQGLVVMDSSNNTGHVAKGTESSLINSIAYAKVDGQQYVAFGDGNSGLHLWSKGVVTELTKERCRTIYQAPCSDRIYFIVSDNLHFVDRRSGKWVFGVAGLSGIVEILSVDDSCSLWLLRKNEVLRVDAANPSKILAQFEIENLVTATRPQRNRVAVVADNKLLYYDPRSGKWREFEMVKKLVRERIFGYVWMNDRLMLVTKGPTYFVDPKFTEVKRFDPWPRLHKGESLSTVFGDSTGYLWFGFDDTRILARYNPTADSRNYLKDFNAYVVQARTRNDSVLFDGGSIKEQVEIHLSYQEADISFLYAAPFFDGENRTQFRYRLIGFDETWSEWSVEKTEKEYTSLPEGKYIFQVQAKNIYDQESNIGVFGFQVLPPWYRTWWGYILQGIGLALVGYFSVLLYGRRLRRKNVLLELAVSKRTDELKESNEKLGKTVDQLSDTLRELRLSQEHIIKSEKMVSLGQLSAGIAHEINNPLNYIQGGLEALKVLKDEIADNSSRSGDKQEDQVLHEIGEVIHVMERGIQKAEDIVRGMQVFSGRGTSVHQETDIADCIRSALLMIENRAKSYHTNIHYVPSHQRKLLINQSEMTQVFVHLLENALRAVKDNDGEKVISIFSYEHDGNLIVDVTDKGHGIAPEHLSSIFNPFFTTRDVGEGKGMGLFVSYNLVERNGGTIGVRSVPGETVFTITFN